MGALTRLGGGVVLGASLVSACAQKAERPPYTDSDQEGDKPVTPRPSPTPDDSEAARGETSAAAPSSATTSGEQASLESSAAVSSGEGATSERDATGNPEVPLPDGYSALHVWARQTLWTDLLRMIAASPTGQVYVSDGENVYEVVDGEPSLFTDAAALGYDADYTLPGLAVDETGNVHVFVQPMGGTAVDHVLDPQGNEVEVLTVSETAISYPTVSPQGDVYFVDAEGVHTSVDGFVSTIATVAELGGAAATGCDAEALVVGPERFYYLPGCEGSPIYFGMRDGTYNQLLVEVNDVQTGADHIVGDNHYYGFEGIAPHPLGGVVLNFEQLLLRIHDNGSWELFETSPWPGQVREEGSPFHSSPVAVDDFSAYLLAEDHIWIADGLFTH